MQTSLCQKTSRKLFGMIQPVSVGCELLRGRAVGSKTPEKTSRTIDTNMLAARPVSAFKIDQKFSSVRLFFAGPETLAHSVWPPWATVGVPESPQSDFWATLGRRGASEAI